MKSPIVGRLAAKIAGLALVGAATLSLGAAPVHAQATVAAIKKNGILTCGVAQGLPGFSFPDKSGVIMAWTRTSATPSRRRSWAMSARSNSSR